MRAQCAHYSLYQKFFNTCLREWYFQRDGGSGFYYANPPGLLFTQLRTSRLQKGTFSAPFAHWYFEYNVSRDKSHHTVSNSSLFGASSSIQGGTLIESILHIGYGPWYSNALGKHVAKYTDTYHVAFCNYYDVAFNTLYNVGRNFDMSPDALDTFKNFRLLTGNIFNIHLLLTEPCFKCAIVSLTPENTHYMLHWKTLTSIANALTTNGRILFLAKEKDLLKQVQNTLNKPSMIKLFMRSEMLDAPGLAKADAITWTNDKIPAVIAEPTTREFLEAVQKYEQNSLTGPLHLVVYDKRISTLPNQRLRKPVNTM